MKKILSAAFGFMLVLFVQVAFGDPPQDGLWQEHLKNNGKMSKNTLKPIPCPNESNELGCFSGEARLTGVVVHSWEKSTEQDREAQYESQVFFYPDKNLDLPFLYHSSCDENAMKFYGAVYDKKTRKYDCSNITYERLDFGAIIRDTYVLPKNLFVVGLGESGARAEVLIEDYYFYSEGSKGKIAGVSIKEFKQLGETYEDTTPLNKADYTKQNIVISGVSYNILKYKSKDSYVNLRSYHDTKSSIKAQIQADDIKNGRAAILYVGYGNKNWTYVYYLSPQAKKPNDGIFGYIHNSQISFHQKKF